MSTGLDISRDFPITVFLSGVMFTCFVASGLFFYKFWRKTQEKFFWFFSLACWMLGVERIPLLVLRTTLEVHPWVYLFRLCAFLLIFFGTYHVNKRAKTKKWGDSPRVKVLTPES